MTLELLFLSSHHYGVPDTFVHVRVVRGQEEQADDMASHDPWQEHGNKYIVQVDKAEGAEKLRYGAYPVQQKAVH
jgi:hypothetical protein